MDARSLTRAIGRGLAGGVGIAAASYATVVGLTWIRYGHVTHAAIGDESDVLLDRFMPTYEVVERHQIRIDAPVDATFAAASEMDLQRSRTVQAVFKGREWILGSHPARDEETRAFVPRMLAIGWGKLAEIPGREVVMGAVTQPW